MIDIIVPIYEGLDETKQCINSILNVKSKEQYHLTIINDSSPNVKINELLHSYKANSKITVLENTENIGFVKTVNKGIKITKNDVIILNSDTVVTDKWIDKLKIAAYSNSKIGSVTALTNNGTIASVPIFNKDNDLPKGYSIDEFSTLIEKVSEKVYPVIPTAVGHAMFIKRNIIDRVGLFDEENFGKGYGEEEDFSARIIKKGYLNILADDTFIYHHGSTSFKSNKRELITKNKRILKKKHKLHAIRVKNFILFDKKVKRLCKNIQKSL